MAVTVTIDYFSGIPNPHWELKPAQIAELSKRLADLPAVPAETIPPHFPRVGYNGLAVTATKGELPDFDVWNGRVLEQSKSAIVRADRGLRLEQFLFESAPSTIEQTYGMTFAS